MARELKKLSWWIKTVGIGLMLLGAAGIALQVWLRMLDYEEMPLGMLAFVAGAVLLCIGLVVGEWRLLFGYDDYGEDE